MNRSFYLLKYRSAFTWSLHDCVPLQEGLLSQGRERGCTSPLGKPLTTGEYCWCRANNLSVKAAHGITSEAQRRLGNEQGPYTVQSTVATLQS